MIYHKEQSQRNKNKKKKRQHSGMSSHCMLKRLRDDCRSGNVDLNHPFQRAVTLHCSQVLAGSFSFPFFFYLLGYSSFLLLSLVSSLNEGTCAARPPVCSPLADAALFTAQSGAELYRHESELEQKVKKVVALLEVPT